MNKYKAISIIEFNEKFPNKVSFFTSSELDLCDVTVECVYPLGECARCPMAEKASQDAMSDILEEGYTPELAEEAYEMLKLLGEL